jgi:hypothetical protein
MVTVKWQKDAGLTELSTTSEGPLDADGRSAHWVAHYYSPSAKQVYLTSLDAGKVTHIAHPSNELKTVPLEADSILDTKRLREIAEDAGGAKCTAKGATLTLGLSRTAAAPSGTSTTQTKDLENIGTIVINANGGRSSSWI